MKKVIYSTFCAVGAIALATSCSDFLETSSPSKTDAAFVFSTSETARAALEGAYAAWVDAAQNKVFGDGLFYAADVAGSDIERHPEKFEAQPGRHYPECFYQNGKYAGEYALPISISMNRNKYDFISTNLLADSVHTITSFSQ